MGTINLSHKIISHLVVGRSRVGTDIGRCRFGFNGIYKEYFNYIIIFESEAKGGICRIWIGC